MSEFDRTAAFIPLTVEELREAPSLPPEELLAPIVPVPEDAPPLRFKHPEHGEPTGIWEYRGVDGRLIGYVARFDYIESDGTPGRTYFPLTYCTNGTKTAWRAHRFPPPFPLYRLPELFARANAPVLICQGEKTADAAARLFPNFVVTTSPFGVQFVQAADWSALTGRKVIVAPDFGDDAETFSDAVCNEAYRAGACEVLVLRPEKLGRWVWDQGFRLERRSIPVGWDLGDAEEDGWTTAGISAAIAESGLFEVAPRPLVRDEAGEPLFRMGKEGVEARVVKRNHRGAITSVTWKWICSPLEIIAETRDGQDANWGKLLRFRNPDGQEVEWLLPNEMLAADGASYRTELLSLGIAINGSKRSRELLHEYLAKVSSDARARSVDRGGWHGRAYVTSAGTHGFQPSAERFVFQASGHARIGNVAGTLQGWRENVAKLAEGNSRLGFAVSAAFAAPLLRLTGAESGGFHLVGSSSVGKTTALAVAGSVWGGGGPGGYVRSWRATSNGLEGVATAHNDCLLCLDEMGQVRGSEAGACAYMLANGVGKARATKTGAARRPAVWSLLFLSTGEVRLADKIAEDGRERPVAAGQQVRIVDIEADAGAGQGIFQNLHGKESAESLARLLKQAAETDYGHAGPAFVDHLATDLEGLSAKARAMTDQFVIENRPSTSCDGQVLRVARRFGLVAASGELAIEAGLLPWVQGEAKLAAATCFGDWLAARGTIGSLEDDAMVAEVRAFIEQHGATRFVQAKEEEDELPQDRVFLRNRVGFLRLTKDKATEYCFFSATWDKLWSGRSPKAVARVLNERGFLKTAADRMNKVVRFGAKHYRCYVVKETILIEPPPVKAAETSLRQYMELPAEPFPERLPDQLGHKPRDRLQEKLRRISQC